MMFSVIIPMYNSSRTILRALNSVGSQTNRDSVKEIIVVDDGSTDDGPDQVVQFQQNQSTVHVRLITQPNRGVASARNVGVRASTADWIALLDADDEWMPQKLEVQRQILQERHDIDFLGCEINDFPVNLYFKKLRYLSKISLHDLLIKTFPQTSTLVFRRSLFDSIHGFDESMSHGEDGRFIMNAVSDFNCYYYPTKLVVYDRGKPGFGADGLSSNVVAMHAAEMDNLYYLRRTNRISFFVFILSLCFSSARYLRRRVLLIAQ